jgi:hypothetical protein
MTMIESVFPDVQGYFADVVTPGLARAIDDGAKVSFLQHEAHKWEKAEGKLAAWAQRSDETPHPFSPPLDRNSVRSIIADLQAQMAKFSVLPADHVAENFLEYAERAS